MKIKIAIFLILSSLILSFLIIWLGQNARGVLMVQIFDDDKYIQFMYTKLNQNFHETKAIPGNIYKAYTVDDLHAAVVDGKLIVTVHNLEYYFNSGNFVITYN